MLGLGVLGVPHGPHAHGPQQGQGPVLQQGQSPKVLGQGPYLLGQGPDLQQGQGPNGPDLQLGQGAKMMNLMPSPLQRMPLTKR